MVILPVEPGRERINAPSGENTAKSGDAFARILAASLDKEKPGGGRDKVAETAEMLRLEMMRSAVSVTADNPEPTTTTVSNALKMFMTSYAEAGQKTDTPASKLPLTEQSPTSGQTAAVLAGTPAENHSTTPFDTIINRAAMRYNVPEALIKAVIRMESDFNPRAVSHAGAQGLMQLMPSTAAGLGVRNAFDPEQNIMAGTRFLRELLEKYGGDLDSTLAAYNWGPGNVDRSHGAFLPRETREYLVKVKKYYAQYVG